jgi:DNA-binding response OmpR family regulator
VIPVDDRLSVEFTHQRVTIDGRSVPLTPTETKLLYVLMRNAGRLITTDFLLRRLWPLEEIFEDALRVHIHRLRRKIEPDPGDPQYILTERGHGYLFVAEA